MMQKLSCVVDVQNHQLGAVVFVALRKINLKTSSVLLGRNQGRDQMILSHSSALSLLLLCCSRTASPRDLSVFKRANLLVLHFSGVGCKTLPQGGSCFAD